jgi:hypothetical protein
MSTNTELDRVTLFPIAIFNPDSAPPQDAPQASSIPVAAVPKATFPDVECCPRPALGHATCDALGVAVATTVVYSASTV